MLVGLSYGRGATERRLWTRVITVGAIALWSAYRRVLTSAEFSSESMEILYIELLPNFFGAISR